MLHLELYSVDERSMSGVLPPMRIWNKTNRKDNTSGHNQIQYESYVGESPNLPSNLLELQIPKSKEFLKSTASKRLLDMFGDNCM